LTPGEATVAVNLYDNKDTGNHASADSLDIRLGRPENVTTKIGDQTITQTRIPVQIMTSNKDQDFGFQGRGNLHFTITDSQKNTFKGDHAAVVSATREIGRGHEHTFVNDAGRKTFNVPK
jgi:hypothetical protein